LIRASPGLQSGEAGFQTRENALSCNDRALAPVRMPQAPQSTRTFFVTSTTAGRRALLPSDRMAQLLVDVLAENRRRSRFLLHEFLIMPNHFHLLLTPAAEIPLEKALQFIKGGFYYRAKREIHFAFEIWQAGFVNHGIRDAEDYKYHHTYIWENSQLQKCRNSRQGPRKRPLCSANLGALRPYLANPPPPRIENASDLCLRARFMASICSTVSVSTPRVSFPASKPVNSSL
jgi:putative transposase